MPISEATRNRYNQLIDRATEEVSPMPDEGKIYRPFESMTDEAAGRIVVHDFDNAASYRNQNHDWRWQNADLVYTAWKNPKYWEGTSIQRANIGVFLAFEQIEAATPRIVQSLFGDQEWFEALPMGNTTPRAARKCQDLVRSQLNYSNPKEQIRRCIKSILTYGNGIMMSGWEHKITQTLQFTPEFLPIKRPTFDPISGHFTDMPTGEYRRVMHEAIVENSVNRPFMRNVSLKRIYVDPNTPSVLLSEAGYLIHETYMSVEDLDLLRDEPGFEYMPDRYTLWLCAQDKGYDISDSTQSMTETARQGSWQPSMDQSTDPAKARIKVHIHITPNRVVWMLNKLYVVYNKPNELGRITYYNGYYADLCDRFYAMSVTDVLEPEQRVQEALLGTRLDELSLAIHPHTVRQRTASTSVYQARVRPGGVSDSSDPKNDFIRQYPMNATKDSFLEIQASDLRGQKATGFTDLAILGVGTPVNPTAKTATGANLQGQASAGRVLGITMGLETTIFEPMLADVAEYNNHFLDPNEMQEAMNGEPIDPMEVFGAKVRYEMRASSRMISRQALIQMMPMTMQALMNPALLTQLQAEGKTVDFEELLQVYMDASGYRKKFNWIRPLTPQEQKLLNKPSPDEIKHQMQKERMEVMHDMQADQNESDMLTEVMKMLTQLRGQKLNSKKSITSGGGSQ